MTLGFIGKFYVLAVGVQAGLWWLTAGVVIGSAIGLYYYLRVAVSLYLSAPQQLNRDAPSNWQYSAGDRGADLRASGANLRYLSAAAD